MFSVELTINENLYKNDPQRTDLGRKILQHSILMIDECGLERFNFRKLAVRIGSTEASIYRYFENKQRLLIYLVNWYWEWMRFRIELKVLEIEDPLLKLQAVISCIVDTAKRNTSISYIDEDVLHRIVVAEGTKAYHNKAVDLQNREGFFLAYKALCKRIAGVILENNPEFPYPHTLASNMLEMANNHIFFAEHLPRLTDVDGKGDVPRQVEQLLSYFTLRLLKEERVSA
ncbi:TetR/AcrR family transcriptional regulator [Phaeodactylibacter luteus]|uniref:TetR/AcrR family transcriptional regulator n=1 Tax=Phaeodactylibacter luteus TaxID=1564516 RepID=A0A5C6RQH6_9BACT|nr:TetR/AcrR family transcriptional regulator [Phaeodactylibacter luteus]TXB64493.1 TetR/AcrR family transcriptional regulator [Phaeodactylibacter luteus]